MKNLQSCTSTVRLHSILLNEIRIVELKDPDNIEYAKNYYTLALFEIHYSVNYFSIFNRYMRNLSMISVIIN